MLVAISGRAWKQGAPGRELSPAWEEKGELAVPGRAAAGQQCRAQDREGPLKPWDVPHGGGQCNSDPLPAPAHSYGLESLSPGNFCSWDREEK